MGSGPMAWIVQSTINLWIVGGCYRRYVDKIDSNTILLLSLIPCHWIGTMGRCHPPIAMCLLHCALLHCLARHCKRKKRGPYKHSRYQKDFFKTISIEEQCRRYRTIPCCALILLALSPWQKLIALRNNQAYITMMGFDCESFDRILEKFGPMFSGHTPFDASGMIVDFVYARGQKRVVQPADCLGLVLVWTCTRGAMNVLQLVFGLTYCNLSVYF